MEIIHNIENVYAGKKVLITGHNGFKGSWLTLILQMLGAEVMGISLNSGKDLSLYKSLQISTAIREEYIDIRNFENLYNSINSFKPEFIFHLAAQSLVIDSFKDPIDTYSTNIMGSVNLLESIRLIPTIKSLVFITSDKCYENKEWEWGYRENDRLGGSDPYSASKSCAELLFASYHKSFYIDMPYLGVASARSGNVIGGGDWADNRLIPDAIRAVINGKALKLRNPNSTRPWQHVLDPLYAYLKLGYFLYKEPNKWSGSSWNFGPDNINCATVLQMSRLLYKYIPSGKIELHIAENNLRETVNLQLNCDKAFKLMGWRGLWSPETAIKKTAEWYRLFLENPSDLAEFTRNQVTDFFKEETSRDKFENMSDVRSILP